MVARKKRVTPPIEAALASLGRSLIHRKLCGLRTPTVNSRLLEHGFKDEAGIPLIYFLRYVDKDVPTFLEFTVRSHPRLAQEAPSDPARAFFSLVHSSAEIFGASAHHASLHNLFTHPGRVGIPSAQVLHKPRIRNQDVVR